MGWAKYKNVRSSGFASKLEHEVYKIYALQEKAGEISDLRCQAKVYLTEARILFIADFTFTRMGQDCFGEAKGYPTDAWKLKRRLFEYYGPGPLEIWQGSHAKPFLSETIIPKL